MHLVRNRPNCRGRCARSAPGLLTSSTIGWASTWPRRSDPRRAFVQENLRWLCRDCHLRKTRFDRLLARYLRACRMDWRAALRAWESNRRWAAVFLDPFGIEFDRKNAARPGFPSAA